MLHTGRQRNIKLDEMTAIEIQELPQLYDLFSKIKSVDDDQGSLFKVAWNVFGGIPFEYLALNDKLVNFSLHHQTDDQRTIMKSTIEDFISERILQAITEVEESRLNNGDLDKILDLMRKNNLELDVMELVEKNLIVSSYDKVLRKEIINSKTVIIPSTKSIGVVVLFNLVEQPFFNDLKLKLDSIQLERNRSI